MDIGWCRYQGRSITWHSPTGFVGPWYREVPGLGFLRSFGGGLFTTAGLDHILFPQEDPNDTYNYPGRTQTEYGLHGRISNIPGVLDYHRERWEGDTCILETEGAVRQAAALAEHLVLRRRIATTLDGRTIAWTDTVENRGHYATPHMMLYHINLGAPLLDSSCELVAPIRQVLFATPTASGEPDEHLRFAEPKPGFLEQAFVHDMAPGSDGRVQVALINRSDPSEPWGVVLRYDADKFPFFFQWRYFDAGTYVLGLEPSTNGLTGRHEARETGELVILQPGESRTHQTELEVVVGTAECDSVRAAINGG
jgi:hypothetical protein